MKTKLRSFALLILTLFGATNAHAWVDIRSVTIRQMIQWEENPWVIVAFSNNVSCHVSSADKQLLALLMLMYSTDMRADVICHDAGENVNGYLDVHKLHRVWAMK